MFTFCYIKMNLGDMWSELVADQLKTKQNKTTTTKTQL